MTLLPPPSDDELLRRLAEKRGPQAVEPRHLRPPVPTEHEEQRALLARVRRAADAFPDLALLYAIPNGGHRQKASAGKLWAEGVKRGVPDLCLPIPRDGYHGLYLELKRVTGGTVSPEQRVWHAALREQGYRVEVCKGADAAWAVLCDYLGIPYTADGQEQAA